jgi:nitrate reductase NapE component
MNQSDSARLRALEQRVEWLTFTVTVLAACVAFSLGLIQVLLAGVFGFVLLLPILAYTHKFLPAAARSIGRFCSMIVRTLHPASSTTRRSVV